MKAQFTKKYGGEFVRRAEQNEDCCVNQKVTEKLGCDPPSAYVVTVRLHSRERDKFSDVFHTVARTGGTVGL